MRAMRPFVPLAVIVVVLAFTMSVTAAHNVTDEGLQERLDRLKEAELDLEDPAELEVQDVDEAVWGVSDLLSGAGGFLQTIGDALGTGLAHAGALASTSLQAATAALAVALVATREALVWSVTGVAGLMMGTLKAGLDSIVAVVTGAWGALASLAVTAAYGRPAGMSQAAWVTTVAVGVTGTTAAVHYGFWQLLRRFGWLAAGLPLFSRIEKDDLLDHPLRSEIYEAIKASPGIHISQLARTVDAGWGTTIHHLRKLKDEDMVAVRTVNNQKCYFVNGNGLGRDSWAAVSALKNETARKIAQFVHANPLIAVTELSKRLGISASLVSHHVAKLSRAGVLEKVRDGRFIRLTITEKAAPTMTGQTPVSPVAAAPLAA